MAATTRTSPRIAQASSDRQDQWLLQEVLYHKPYAGSSAEYEAIAWNKIRLAFRKKCQGGPANVEEKYEQLYAAWRNNRDQESKLDPRSRELLEEIQRDVASCSLVRPPARQPLANPLSVAAAPSTPATATAQPSPSSQTQNSPAATQETPPVKPSPKPRAKRVKKAPGDQPAAKKPRGRPRSNARGGPPLENPSSDNRGVEIPVGPNGTAVDVSPDAMGSRLVLANSASQFPKDIMRTVSERLAMGERETVGVVELMRGVVEAQRERQRDAARTIADLVKYRYQA